MNNILKYITIALFIGFISIVPIITLATPDKKVSSIENKILTQMPKASFRNIKNKSFMALFDKYTSDQFPLRTNFLELKNSFNYISGQREFRNIYISKSGKLLERFIYNQDIIDSNIRTILDLSTSLRGKHNIQTKLMIIPTSIVFYENELPSWAITDNIKNAIKYIESIASKSDTIDFYSPIEILEKYKDEYIYFNTDHHWTQLGAKLAYEDMYNTQISDTPAKVTDNFYGTYYSKALLPKVNGDSIYAYSNFNNHKSQIDFTQNYNTLYGPDKLNGKNKYQYFLHGDPGFAVIEGNPNSSNEILIFKDSYAHNFIPFLTSNYKTIHVVDPRYYNMDLDTYLSNHRNISEVLFINNIQTINSNIIFKNSQKINKSI